MVTELHDEMAKRLRGTGQNPWDEYGSTTGRPRRVGWLDAVALRHAVRVNGINELALTKLDILSGIQTLNIATSYKHNGTRLADFPQDSELLAECQPIYEELAGWQEDISTVRSYDALPANAQAYIHRIEVLTGARVAIASVGPEREQMITR